MNSETFDSMNRSNFHQKKMFDKDDHQSLSRIPFRNHESSYFEDASNFLEVNLQTTQLPKKLNLKENRSFDWDRSKKTLDKS